MNFYFDGFEMESDSVEILLVAIFLVEISEVSGGNGNVLTQ